MGSANRITDKQEKFVQGLLKGLSQREAYKQAYDTSKMSNKIIDEKACRLFKNLKVRARYDEIHGKVVEKIEREGAITHERIIKEIASIALDDISNYLEYKKNPKAKYGVDIIVKDSKEIDTKNISEISLGKDGFKFKLYCKDVALYKLAEIFNLKEKINEKEIEEGIEIKWE